MPSIGPVSWSICHDVPAPHRRANLYPFLLFGDRLGTGLLTEEEVVSILNGKSQTVIPRHPSGFALHATVSPSPKAGATGKREQKGTHQHEADALYKVLIPLVRAIEAAVWHGSRHAVRMVPTSLLPAEQANKVGRQLADTVERFLTTYFAIARERLSLQIVLPDSTVARPATPLLEPQRWRLEVFGQECSR